MGELFGAEAEIIVAANLLFSFLLLIGVIILGLRLRKMKKKHQQLLNGESNVNIEELLIRIQEELNQHQTVMNATKNKVEHLSESLKTMKANTGIHRYNAFHENGNDLSFSIALLDEFQNGIMITGIHSREQTYVYAKPVENGDSKYALSPEEKIAISLTAKQKLQA